MQKIKSGIYIHIPFCESRCIYCGFYSTTQRAFHTRYVAALCREMEMRRDTIVCTSGGKGTCEADTIYLGGGTPSVLPSEETGRILEKAYTIYGSEPREVTMEMNPDDITPQLVSDVRSFGVNRISMGIQTFNDERLRFLRRRHTASVARRAVDTVRHGGVDNVSIDLMFGFPGETLADWLSDIEEALKLEPSHISAYCLMYEEGTPLYRMLKEGRTSPIGEDDYLAMYTELMDRLAAAGYEHYEISNFALPGCRAMHNSSYWHDTPYLGFGAAAHSYLGDSRTWNADSLAGYMEAIERGTLPSEGETIDSDTHYNDLITTALRTREGLDLSRLSESHRQYALLNARESLAAGLLRKEGDRIMLTRKGLFVSDMIMSDLIKV